MTKDEQHTGRHHKDFSGDDLSNKQTVVHFGQMGPNGTAGKKEENRKTI